MPCWHTEPLGGLWSGPRRREEWVVRALSALHLHTRDRQYIVRDDAVQIVDPLTGRVSPDRSWDAGLHQLIELKEGCALTPRNETIARISAQQFFRRYLHLSGMTGTAREVAGELAGTYGLDPVAVPTRKPIRRRDLGTRLLPRATAQWQIVVERVAELRAAGRPVLVGTGSVEASQALSALLREAGIPHQVLNAYQDADEARLVAQAGQAGAITVATSMAGRGTDIHLGEGVAERGGLHVIATERAEASRVDRQLSGRCGRQGEPGSHEVVASVEDERLALHGEKTRLRVARLVGSVASQRPIPKLLAESLLSTAQRAEERRDRRSRAAIEMLDEQLDRTLTFAGRSE